MRCYPDAAMRLAVSRAIARETPRGWKIAKEKSSHKIDVVVALAMACHAAVQGAHQSSYSLDAFQDDWIDLDAPNREQPVDANTEYFRNQLLAFCNGQINGRRRTVGVSE